MRVTAGTVTHKLVSSDGDHMTVDVLPQIEGISLLEMCQEM